IMKMIHRRSRRSSQSRKGKWWRSKSDEGVHGGEEESEKGEMEEGRRSRWMKVLLGNKKWCHLTHESCFPKQSMISRSILLNQVYSMTLSVLFSTGKEVLPLLINPD